MQTPTKDERQLYPRHLRLIATFCFCLSLLFVNVSACHASVLSSCQNGLLLIGKNINHLLHRTFHEKRNDPLKMAKSLGVEVGNLAKFRDLVASEMDDYFYTHPISEIFAIDVKRQKHWQSALESKMQTTYVNSGFSSIEEAKRVSQLTDVDTIHRLVYDPQNGSITGSYLAGMNDEKMYGIPNHVQFGAIESITSVGGAFLVITDRTVRGLGTSVIQYRLFSSKKAALAWTNRFNSRETRDYLRTMILTDLSFSESALLTMLETSLMIKHHLKANQIIAGLNQLLFEMFGRAIPFSEGIHCRLIDNRLQVEIASQTESHPQKLLEKFVIANQVDFFSKNMAIITSLQENVIDYRGYLLTIPLKIQLNVPIIP